MTRSFTWEVIDAEFDSETVTADQINDFLADPDVNELVERVTRRMIRTFSLDWERHHEDLRNECRLLVFLMLTDPAANAAAHRIRGGLATALYAKFSDRVKSLVESAEWTGSHGMSQTIRRRRGLRMHAIRMQENDSHEPSGSELIESYNAQIRLRRKDPERQGALASMTDLISLDTAPLEMAESVPVAMSMDDQPLFSTEAPMLLAAVLRKAAAEGGYVAVVTGAWLGHYDDRPPYIATVTEIADATGLPEDVVMEAQSQAMTLARQVLAEDFGITEDDWR